MTDVHDLLARALGGVAPSPDALQATIQRIRRRQRRRRVLVACVTLAVFAGAGVVVTRVADDGGDPLSTPAPTTVTPSSVASSTVPPSPAGFVPRTTREGNRTVLPVTFPDGSTSELVYPTALGLAGMGVQPDVSFLRVQDPGPRYELGFSRGGRGPAGRQGARPAAGRLPGCSGGTGQSGATRPPRAARSSSGRRSRIPASCPATATGCSIGSAPGPSWPASLTGRWRPRWPATWAAARPAMASWWAKPAARSPCPGSTERAAAPSSPSGTTARCPSSSSPSPGG